MRTQIPLFCFVFLTLFLRCRVDPVVSWLNITVRGHLKSKRWSLIYVWPSYSSLCICQLGAPVILPKTQLGVSAVKLKIVELNANTFRHFHLPVRAAKFTGVTLYSTYLLKWNTSRMVSLNNKTKTKMKKKTEMWDKFGHSCLRSNQDDISGFC